MEEREKGLFEKICDKVNELKSTRRDFIKTSAFLGGSALFAERIRWALDVLERAEAGELLPGEEYELAKAENILYSVCLQCNTGCGIKTKILDGVVVKIDGNPLSPWTLYPHLPYETSPFDTATVDGALCPKGQAGLQTVYDPYRIRKVLKRAGKRGENKWITIPFDQAIDEIVSGGYLFKNVKGEENRYVPGLKDIWVLRDSKVAKKMSKAVDEILHEKDKVKKKELVERFKAEFKDYLDKMIDPNHPDLGPINNQMVFMWGRLKDGRGDLIKRFTLDAFGSINAHGHTTVCQGSLYFTGKAMSEQWKLDEKEKKVKWTEGKKFYWQGELEHAEFVIFVGASPFEANYGPPFRTARITDRLVSGRLKYAVIDPRLSKTAGKAWRWIPAKPGTEGAFALGMIRWIIENKRFDSKYLMNANKAAAKEDKEPTWTNAVWLVKIEDGKPSVFLRAHEVGFPKEERTQKVKDEEVKYEYEKFVVLKNGSLVPVDPYDEKTPVEGDLFIDTEINGIRVKSVMQLLYEEASKKTIEEWAEICGVRPEDVIELAYEFTNHGRRAVCDVHRGASQHTNGFYNNLAWFTLNLLIGNYDYKGGFIQKSEYKPSGEKEEQPFNLKEMHPGKTTPFGISIIRHGMKYEDTTLFEGYPAKRPWFPLASDVYQEIIPSIGDAYPYPIKALILYMGTPVYSLPGGGSLIEILSDPSKLPLFVAIDITVGETSMFADYIFPDTTYLERWEFHGSHPSIPYKVQPVRQPVIPPIPEVVKVFGEEMPISLEAFILGVAEKLGLSGFGPNGFGEGKPLTHPDHLYLKMVANVAMEGKPVPDADDKEVELFMKVRRHLPKAVFDPERWERSVGGENFKKVIYVLNRGGRFQNYEDAWDGEQVKNKYGTLVNMYLEKVAKTKNSMTGKPFIGIASYIPAPTDVLGNPIEDKEDGFDLNLITYRVIQHTKSRTVSNYWLLSIQPENSILINKRDAERLGFKDGDEVKIISKTNSDGMWNLTDGDKKPMVGKLKAIQGIRPGVVAFSLGFGHFAYGARDITVDGKVVKRDKRREKGIHANAVMRLDPVLKNTPLEDLTGGSVSFYDTKVKLVKA
jgi:anaerobic selenocysteine-containing dehydrogenase